MKYGISGTTHSPCLLVHATCRRTSRHFSTNEASDLYCAYSRIRLVPLPKPVVASRRTFIGTHRPIFAPCECA